MDTFKPTITSGDPELPVDELSPSEFERLCFWLIEREGFKSVKHLEFKDKQGYDILAEKDGRSWGFQCKRVKRFGPYEADQELEKLAGADIPDVFVFMVACSVSHYTWRKVHKKIPNIEIDFWARSELDELIKRHPDIMAEFFLIGSGEKGIRKEPALQEFIDSVERWRSNNANETDLLKIANVLQSGGVNLGQNNQVKVSGPVIGTVNLQFQTHSQAMKFLDQLMGRDGIVKSPPNKIQIRRKIDAFLCHAKEDKPDVRKLYESLRDDNVNPWLDEEELLGGQDWEAEIRKAVRKADVVIVCLSRNSTSKEGFIQKEISLALDKAEEKPEGTIYIIPLKLHECEVPSRLKRWHWINLFETRGYKKLIKALADRAQDLGLDPIQA